MIKWKHISKFKNISAYEMRFTDLNLLLETRLFIHLLKVSYWVVELHESRLEYYRGSMGSGKCLKRLKYLK